MDRQQSRAGCAGEAFTCSILIPEAYCKAEISLDPGKPMTSGYKRAIPIDLHG